MSNTAIAKAQKPKFSVAIQTEGYKKLINNTLQDPKRAQRFVAAISSAVAVNPALQECDAGTILSCALLGESLNLSPSPQLGQYYLVPFKDNKNNRMVATFILGYKGYIQLAIRSGQYKNIDVLEIKKGELNSYNPFTGEIDINIIQDELVRETAETVGYYAYLKYLNGFEKSFYWSKDKMEQHALRYSKGYAAKKGYTHWEKNFDAMALKTMIRQLISKWGFMSIEMREAYERDTAMIDADGTVEYVDGAEIGEVVAEVNPQPPDDTPTESASEPPKGDDADSDDAEQVSMDEL
ncbi:MAG: recombinase RecT [Oscillospiraceae bacterium]|nr:recombinase RecT [Oscillospiraceae bacterium]MCL2278131.1 recombinase RecT [Oscillospiraceae bacterium]